MDPDSCACIPGKNSLALFICILTRPHLAQQPDPFLKKQKKQYNWRAGYVFKRMNQKSKCDVVSCKLPPGPDISCSEGAGFGFTTVRDNVWQEMRVGFLI